MDSDQIWAYFWLKAVFTVAVFIVCMTFIIQFENAYETKKFIEAGFNLKPIPGQLGTHWVKPECK